MTLVKELREQLEELTKKLDAKENVAKKAVEKKTAAPKKAEVKKAEVKTQSSSAPTKGRGQTQLRRQHHLTKKSTGTWSLRHQQLTPSRHHRSQKWTKIRDQK